jgi:hypothetical protein
MVYGPNTFTQCTWCTEDVDYFTYHLPVVGQQYIIALLVLGALTACLPSKAGFRNYFAWIIICSFVAEASMLWLGEEYRNELMTMIYPPPTRRREFGRSRESPLDYFPPVYRAFHLARYALFAGMLLFMMFKDSPQTAKGRESEQLENELERLRGSLKRLQGSNYLQRTITSDTELRSVVNSNHMKVRDPLKKIFSTDSVRRAMDEQEAKISAVGGEKPWEHKADQIMRSVQLVQDVGAFQAKRKHA